MLPLVVMLPLKANHLTGGEMFYECIGTGPNGNPLVKVTLVVFRDNLSMGAAFDNPAYLSVFNLDAQTLRQNISATRTTFSTVPVNDLGPCARNIPPVDIQKATYVFNVELAPNTKGYQITHQRCCRNDRISNLNFPADQGSTFTINIPAAALTTCNASPIFKNNPPILICANTPFKFDFSVNDRDGDSVSYSLCSPFQGADQDDPAPEFPDRPPYVPVVYRNGYSATQPLGASANLTMNPRTGELNMIPDKLGIFTVGICVNEYKNGVLIGSILRDIQFNITDCVIAKADASVTASQPIPGVFAACNNFTIKFNNSSTGNTKNFWDFGVAGVDNDTSIASTPTFTYPDTGTYKVTLIINKGTTCSDTAEITLKLYPNLKPAFNSAFTCFENPVVFNDVSTTDISIDVINSWEWHFGDGTKAIGKNVQHNYTASGNYQVKLIVGTQLGCKDSIIKTNNVPAKPVATFTTNALAAGVGAVVRCSDTRTVTFNNTSPPGSTSYWDFGVSGISTDTSTQNSPTFNFPADGIYTVSLIINRGLPCADTTTLSVRVIPEVKPSFTYTNECAKAPVSFLPVLNRAFDTASTYTWTFGDGSAISTLKSPVKTYNNPGTYNVKLSIKSIAGCIGEVTLPITLDSLPFADFLPTGTKAPNGDFIGCGSTFPVNFVNQSRRAITSHWDFGVPTITNDTSVATSPLYSYPSFSSYTVRLIVNKGKVCSDTAIKTIRIVDGLRGDFSFTTACAKNSIQFTDRSVAPLNDISNYEWSFGDGNTSNLKNPSHIYINPGTFTVRLIVNTALGCADTIIKSIEVYPVPVANFNVTAACPSSPLVLQNNSTIATGTISTHLWNLGDGRTSTQVSPTVTYNTPNTYTLSLIVTSDKGCKDTITDQLLVRQKAVVDFNYTNQCVKDLVALNENITTAYNDISILTWSMGNGDTITGSKPTYKYNAPGNYIIKLIVKSSLGCIDSISKPIIIAPAPVAQYTIDGLRLSPGQFVKCGDGLEVNFINNSSGNASNNWDFGLPGNTDISSLAAPQYVYPDTGTYFVRLIINQGTVCSDTAINSIRVLPALNVNFNVADDCVNNQLVFDNTSTSTLNDINSTTWQFGEGSTSSQFDTRFRYANPGKYTVSLIVSTVRGCLDTLQKPVEVFPMPEAIFDVNEACPGQALRLNNQSKISAGTITNYDWTFGNGTISTDRNPSVTYSNPGPFVVQLIVKSNKGCLDTLVDRVNVRDFVDVNIVSSTSEFCQNAPIQFRDASTGIYQTVQWEFGDGSVGEGSEIEYSYTSTGNFIVKMTVNDSLCGSFSETLAINVIPAPVVNLGADFFLCPELSKQVTIGNTPYEEVVWSNGSTNVNTVSINGNIGELSVEVRDKGCVVRDSVVVTASCDVLIPIAFSPNGDGINDVFNVLPSNISTFTLEVFNRWGEKVFSTSSLSNGWDGVYKNEPQPVDGYTYYLQGIRLDGEPFQQKGVVMLLR